MTDFAISFTADAPSRESVPTHSIFVWPVEPNWNDFGYGFQAKAYVRKDNSGPIAIKEFSLFVVPWPLNNFRRFNTWLDQERRNHSSTAGDLTPPSDFLSILKNESLYRELIRFCDGNVELAGRILRPLRDVVYRRWQNIDYAQLHDFVRSDAVNKGVFRHEGAYLAWHRGVRIVAGELAQPITDAQVNFEFSASLPGFAGAHQLGVRFGVPAPLVDRCHALIGQNGVGKSQLLRELVLELGRRIDGTKTTPFLDEGTPAGRDVSLIPDTFIVNRIVAMTWDSRSPNCPRRREWTQYSSTYTFQ